MRIAPESDTMCILPYYILTCVIPHEIDKDKPSRVFLLNKS